ncbi:MAG: PEP-utilizing enzyme, partial [Acidimicrobiales bacterium]|nr:PEP-utilizing enzyme [Acidimicrobiales bacterium]
MGERPWVVGLDDEAAADPAVAGAKAANIARLAVAGFPTMRGFVLTTDGAAQDPRDPEVAPVLRSAWAALGGERGTPVVVRSSSTIEDAGTSSMAGRFTSVLDVVGWEAFLAAVDRVRASAEAVRDADGVARPIGVLVQEQLAAPMGGVLFGVDPVTGATDHVVVEVVPSRPDTLVGGEVTADHYVLGRRGRLVDVARTGVAPDLPRSLRRRLVATARRAAEVFGGPQDMEWAVREDGGLVVLQTRPVTAVAAPGSGLLLGPGPLAETFPNPLRPLEADLWLVPVRDGIVRALRATGAVSERALDASPVVTAVGGRAAVDLALLGVVAGRVGVLRRYSPAAILRRLTTAWRVGRLRVALPDLAAGVVATVDHDLAGVPQLAELATTELSVLLDATRRELTTAHAYEVLCGMLLGEEGGEPPVPLLAMAALSEGRAAGCSDDRIVATRPEVLALVPPSAAAAPVLPAMAAPPVGRAAGPGARLDDVSLRDALRLRVRWLQELGARAARELGVRLAAEGRLAEPAHVLELSLDELAHVVAGAPAPADLAARAAVPAGPPLPTSFRLAATGAVRPVPRRSGVAAAGRPAGGGRGTGTVRQVVPGETVAPGVEPAGFVLVTRFLEPGLATVLPSLSGLVAETGSALSHLAILAREMGVPTVVG